VCAFIRFLFIFSGWVMFHSTFRLVVRQPIGVYLWICSAIYSTFFWFSDVLKISRNLTVRNAVHCLRTTFLRALCSFWAAGAAGASILLLTRQPSSCLPEGEDCSLGSTQSGPAAFLHAAPHTRQPTNVPHCWVCRYSPPLFVSRILPPLQLSHHHPVSLSLYPLVSPSALSRVQ
jgi:hypothetical protein